MPLPASGNTVIAGSLAPTWGRNAKKQPLAPWCRVSDVVAICHHNFIFGPMSLAPFALYIAVWGRLTTI